MAARTYIDSIPEYEPVLQAADHIDIKTTLSEKTLREFIADMMAYQPGWVTFLYSVRAVFVRFLGMHQAGLPRAPRYTPETVPMKPGNKAAFFTVQMAQEDRYWLAEVDDNHLKAGLAIVAEPLTNNQRRFYVITIVHYHNWAGPVYFNVIRPFHHLVVGGMVKAGAHTM